MTLIIIDVMTVYLYRVYLKLFLIIQVELGENFESSQSLQFTVHLRFYGEYLCCSSDRGKKTFVKQLFFNLLADYQQENVIKTIISQWLLSNV